MTQEELETMQAGLRIFERELAKTGGMVQVRGGAGMPMLVAIYDGNDSPSTAVSRMGELGDAAMRALDGYRRRCAARLAAPELPPTFDLGEAGA